MKLAKFEDLEALPIALPESIDTSEYIVATYAIQYPNKIDMREMGQAIAIEQSTGTWTPVPGETPELRKRHVAKMIGLWEIPFYEWSLPDEGERKYIMQVAFPPINFTPQIPMLLTSVMGNISMFGKLKLVDLRFPEKFVAGFPGPKFGTDGMRKLLNTPKRPQINIMIKPCAGWTAQWGADVFREIALGGVDIVKDDELIADAEYNRIEERLPLFLEAERQVFEETGEHTLYAVNITDTLPQVFNNARRAIELGANCLMVNVYATGFPVMQALAEDPEINVPILAHPDVVGATYMSPDHGITAQLLLGKLARLAGADMVVYPHYAGKVPITKDNCLQIGRNLTFPLYDVKPAWPMPGGGVHPYTVESLVEDFGFDIMVGAGGPVHGHPMGPRAGARAFRQAVDAVTAGIALDEAALEYEELRIAIELWKDPHKEHDLAERRI
ncbi:MAG: RuBisCO large subunit C-terminal-like domain-containing protein [Anaerolineales bacterium]|nr:RuBisCO large subunit C-terminal-like domain-containing protein [Anaerolineales bacterium]